MQQVVTGQLRLPQNKRQKLLHKNVGEFLINLQQERHRRSACRPDEVSPAGAAAYGFLKTSFLTHYTGRQSQAVKRRQFFCRSFALLCNHYGIHPVDTNGYAYPYGREVVLHEAGRLLNQKYPQHIEMEVLEDNGNFIVQATETCYTGNTLYYIPVLPVYKMMQDKSHRKAARLLLCVFSYLYHTPHVFLITQKIASCTGSTRWYRNG